ncbi:cupin domain-containing protein [Ramlibacter sp.]|uniref:cupin domain-containing protein n=1 Tax=Ramlibacter sp. TaxID=1917967 RepID=UPI00262F671E|nr:cupin domain-containing protein [Ramlibacter sp.]
MATLGPQLALDACSGAQQRARYFNSANAFNVKLPAVPAQGFHAEAVRALGPDTPTGFIACDQSLAMGMDTPATTPLMLARYARIAPGDCLHADFVASGSIWYVISGAGRASGAETVEWRAGDVMLFGGGGALTLTAGLTGAVLWVVTDEPLLAFGGLLPARGTACVHYPADEIARQIRIIEQATPDEDTSGRALIFSHETLEASRNLLSVLTLSLNTLPPGEAQPAHRHSSAAITLVVQGKDCHSEVGGKQGPWQPWTTLVTPPRAPHSHHNGGTRRAEFLIVQDGGLHYQARTMGFEFL